MQASFLTSIHLFLGASPSTLSRLSEITHRHFYKKNTLILDQAATYKTFLYVVKGWAKVVRESAKGEEIIIDILANHQSYGEDFIFNQPDVLTDLIYTLTDIEVITLPLSTLKLLIISDHLLAMNFLKASFQKQEYRNMEIEHLAIQNAMQRIGCILLRLCGKQQEQSKARVYLPYDKTLLASRLGMRPETFSRALKKLAERCKLEVDDGHVDILDIPTLSHYVCEHCSKIFPCHLPV